MQAWLMKDSTPCHLKVEEMEWDHRHGRQEWEERQTLEMMTLMMTKVITEHPGPEVTHQDGQCQIHMDLPNHLIPNNGQKC